MILVEDAERLDELEAKSQDELEAKSQDELDAERQDEPGENKYLLNNFREKQYKTFLIMNT